MAKTLDAAGVKRLIQEIKGANKNLNTPIPISMENTPESMAQNVKNIADYVEKAKAAGITDVNGMGVTCIIDNDYSGVGYLYAPNGGSTLVTGIITYDDTAASPTAFFVDNEGLYAQREVVIKESSNQVTSDMLVEGARKPIILTPSTTEVDEETYQKLLSDDVDVIFKTADTDANLCALTYREDFGSQWKFVFTCLSGEDRSITDLYIYAYIVSIVKDGVHKCTIDTAYDANFNDFLQANGYLNKSTLSPVLQEIDLGGTDADRKAKLDQFETDWKALTGDTELNGAKFIGRYYADGERFGGPLEILFVKQYFDPYYYIGVGCATSETNTNAVAMSYQGILTPDGSLTITPLFSHLEAITIKIGNTPEDKAANVAAIEAYEDNLESLGLDMTKGYMIPITASGRNGFLSTRSGNYPYVGYGAADSSVSDFYNILILGTGEYYDKKIQSENSGELHTISKQIVGAINEINANAVHSDKLVPTLEAITIKTGNTPEDKAANVAAIKAYVDNLKLLGVDVTKGYMIPFHKYDTNAYGILVGSGENPRLQGYLNGDNTACAYVVDIDGRVAEAFIQLRSDVRLTTTSKNLVDAINEVNALAKGYSTIFAPIELTTDPAQNKTAIDARVAAFTAQGISLTNGCCIPVTYKGVYAGNISLINGDWYGLLVKNTNNPADNINIKLSADGTITEGNSAQ